MVFEISEISQKIIRCITDIPGHTTKELYKNINLRLISKDINKMYLTQIRKNSEHLKIRMTKPDENGEGGIILINDESIPVEKAAELFCFLRDVAKIKIKSVNFLSPFYNPEVHDSFMSILLIPNIKTIKVVTGNEEFCPYYQTEQKCESCRNLAPACLIFGPLTIDTFKSFRKEEIHFVTMRITDYFLQTLALKCATGAISVDILFENHFHKTNISCDCLHVIFSQDQQNCIPIEILEELLKAWKVRKLRFQVSSNQMTMNSDEMSQWSSKFQPFRFSADPQNPGTIKPKEFPVDISTEKKILESIIIDVSKSDIKLANDEKEIGNFNMISNIIKTFPSDGPIFICGPAKTHGFEKVLGNILKNFWKEGEENDEENELQLYLRLNKPVFCGERIGMNVARVSGCTIEGFQCTPVMPWNREIQRMFKQWECIYHPYQYLKTDYIRKMFTLTKGCQVLHLELVLHKSDLEYVKENMETPFQQKIYQHFFQPGEIKEFDEVDILDEVDDIMDSYPEYYDEDYSDESDCDES